MRQIICYMTLILVIQITFTKQNDKIEIQLERGGINNDIYLINVMMGYNYKDRIKLRIDTGSANLLVPSTDCKECRVKYKFNYRKSKTLKMIKRQMNYQLCYGDGCYMTKKGRELMKFKGNKIKGYFQTFFAISAAETLSTVEGILGLNLQSSFMKQINHHKFSLILSNTPGQSKLIIGPYSLTNSIVIPIIPNPQMAYYIQMQSLSINGNYLSKKSHVALLDSGNQLFGLTQSMANKFISLLIKSKVICYFRQEQTPQYKKLSCYHMITNKFTFPSFQFMFSNNKIIMLPHNYVESCYYKIINSVFVKQCDLALEVGGGLVFGAVFFHSFFINFDLKKREIRIAHVSNNK